MSNTIQGGYGIPPMGAYGYTAPAGGPTAPMTTGYGGGDAFAGSGFGPGVDLTQVSVGTVVSDPSVARRFGMFFIKSAESLLKVGGDGGGFGRWFLGLAAGAVPFFTPAARKQEIANNVLAWVGQADLMRSGMSAWDARLMQAGGVANINDLKLYANPNDQLVLAQRLQVIAQAWGSPTWPAPAQINAWVTAAQGLQSRIR